MTNHTRSEMNREFFRNYNYKKHALLCACVYGTLIAFDMTVSYVILKKYFDKLDEKEFLEEYADE